MKHVCEKCLKKYETDYDGDAEFVDASGKSRDICAPCGYELRRRVLMVTTVVADVAAEDVDRFLASTKIAVRTTRDVTFAQQVFMHSFGGWTVQDSTTSERSPQEGEEIVRKRGSDVGGQTPSEVEKGRANWGPDGEDQ